MISESERLLAIELIRQAAKNGAGLKNACDALEISVSTFRRWKSGNITDKRKGAKKTVSRKLRDSERQQIIDISCSEEYKDNNPYEIHASLLDEGIYIASISSFYRILKAHNLVKHRGNTRPAYEQKRPPELKAIGPNQVWCWDISWLKTDVRGVFFYAYVIIDIWDRSIVKWNIHDREDDALARELFEQAIRDTGEPQVFVHSDNGNPMKGATLRAFFEMLGINNSYSRPRVSNDNPFIESFFKTLKYTIAYPKAFSDINNARKWFADFVNAYNMYHQHSGLNYMTPIQVRSGKYQQIAEHRNLVMKKAFKRNPQRWSGPVKQIPENHVVLLNPTADTRISMQNDKKSAA